NPQMFDLIKQHFVEFRQKLNEESYPTELAKLRQSIMANAAQGQYGAASAAAATNLSLRTAQRLAKQHGTSVQQLIDEIRLANAKKILSNPDISIEAVGHLLGYSDARTFRRAFKRWTSLSPREYRRSIFKNDNS
ncbi:MAG: helix-turn-helix domain-containing protein, partial [Cyanobacteria bacterium P01_F01_bin.33]